MVVPVEVESAAHGILLSAARPRPRFSADINLHVGIEQLDGRRAERTLMTLAFMQPVPVFGTFP
jgi:hypothetical protein